MIKVFLSGLLAVVFGALIPIPIEKMSPQQEVQTLIASDDALWRVEQPILSEESKPTNEARAMIKSLVACQARQKAKVSDVETYEGYPAKWEDNTPAPLQPNVVQAVLIEALSYCGESAELIDLDCTERPCVAMMAMPSSVSCQWIKQGSPIQGLVELTSADLEWWPGKSDGFSKAAMEPDDIQRVYIRSYDEADLWESHAIDSQTPGLRLNPDSDSEWAQNILRRALLREEMFIDAVGDGILSAEDAE